MNVQRIDDTTSEPHVRGFLHTASGAKDSLVLTHGAGGDCNFLLLLALAEKLSESGINVLRCDLPYRQVRRTGPPPPGWANKDQQGLANAVALMRERFGGRVFLGGQSYGGRMASMLAAEEPAIADGLLLTSYPLHPAGKSQQRRTAHFPKLKISILFVQGTKDTFATVDEMKLALELIPAKVEHLVIENAGHALVMKKDVAQVTDQIVQAFLRFTESA